MMSSCILRVFCRFRRAFIEPATFVAPLPSALLIFDAISTIAFSVAFFSLTRSLVTEERSSFPGVLRRLGHVTDPSSMSSYTTDTLGSPLRFIILGLQQR